MNFKTIRDKAIDIANQYELSEDGTQLRDVKSGKIIKTNFPEESKVEVDGKKYGVRTLYWGSWNKALPGAKKTQSNSEKVGARKMGDFAPREGRLFSKVFRNEILEFEHWRKKNRHGSLYGQELINSKKRVVRFLLVNEEKRVALVRVNSQCWRDGLWFYNLDSGEHLAFNKGTHKNGKEVVWPQEV